MCSFFVLNAVHSRDAAIPSTRRPALKPALDKQGFYPRCVVHRWWFSSDPVGFVRPSQDHRWLVHTPVQFPGAWALCQMRHERRFECSALLGESAMPGISPSLKVFLVNGHFAVHCSVKVHQARACQTATIQPIGPTRYARWRALFCRQVA